MESRGHGHPVARFELPEGSFWTRCYRRARGLLGALARPICARAGASSEHGAEPESPTPHEKGLRRGAGSMTRPDSSLTSPAGGAHWTTDYERDLSSCSSFAIS